MLAHFSQIWHCPLQFAWCSTKGEHADRSGPYHQVPSSRWQVTSLQSALGAQVPWAQFRGPSVSHSLHSVQLAPPKRTSAQLEQEGPVKLAEHWHWKPAHCGSSTQVPPGPQGSPAHAWHAPQALLSGREALKAR